MRVSTLAMIAVAAITILLSNSPVSAVPLMLQGATTAQDQPATVKAKGPATWKLDNEHTSMVCAVSHYGLSFIYGRFNRCSGTIEMSLQDPESATFRFQVDPDSIDTNDAVRDLALRSSAGLDSLQYDSITFESTEVKLVPALETGDTKRTFQVTGNLVMHGDCLLYTSPSPRDATLSRMPSSA